MASPIPTKLTIEVVPWTEEDIEQLLYWTYNVLERGDPAMDAVFTHPELAFKDAIGTRKVITDPKHVTFKAVIIGGVAIGFVTAWLATDNWIEEEAAVRAKKADPADPEMLSQFLGQSADSRREILGGRAHLFVEFLCVDPAYCRLGAGRKLMEHLFQIAREANVPTYLDSTYVGSQLYRQIGFEVVKISKLVTADGRILEFPSMIDTHDDNMGSNKSSHSKSL